MAASVVVLSYHGDTTNTGDGAYGSPGGSIGGTACQGSEVRFKRAANDTADLNTPVPIPATGTAYSWPKHFKLQATSSPPTRMEALRWYLEPVTEDIDPAVNWTGVSVWVGITTTYRPDTSGMTQWEATPITGVAQSSGGAVGAAVDADNAGYNVATPLTVYPGIFLGAELGVGLTQAFVVVQMSLNSSALPGPKSPRAMLYRWDEI